MISLIYSFGRRRQGLPITQESVMEALRECYDPEIPVNIVDLGLIYAVRIDPVPPEAGTGDTVEVDMTLTAPGCPSSGYISQQVKQRLEQLPGVRAATVNVVWSPPWGPERISPEARKKLGVE